VAEKLNMSDCPKRALEIQAQKDREANRPPPSNIPSGSAAWDIYKGAYGKS